jgi:threonyl-tRNA synthetase
LSEEKLEITLPGNAKVSCQFGTTIREAIASWDQEALVSALAARINRTLVDLSHPLYEPVTIEIIESSSAEGLQILRHSIAHVMAQAVQDQIGRAHV